MFVNIVEFPAIAEGHDEDFRAWFAASNEAFGRFPGFISRQLLRPAGGQGGYVAIVVHESADTFGRMQQSTERGQAWEQVSRFLTGTPRPRFFEIVVG